MDREIAVAGVSASTPGMQREAEAALYWAIGLVAPRMPARFPLHEVVGNVEFLRIDFRAWIEQVDVLLYEIEGIHPKLRCQIIEGAHRDHAHLGMVRGSPGA